MTQYGNFKVLLDDPAEEPSLDFDEYARAFDEIISRSSPQFAIGIFGDWGSGKTTLMRAVWRRFDKRPDVVRVWFNPWRYEREEHLIVPMLDLLREALVEWSDARPSGPVRNHARRAAESAGRAAAPGSASEGGACGRISRSCEALSCRALGRGAPIL